MGDGVAKKQNIRLIDKKRIANGVFVFTFARPKDLDFRAGQYIRIFAPILGENVFRDFTIASAPFEKDTLVLLVKDGISDYKKYLFGISVGSEVLIEAPLGRFYLDEDETNPQVFLAGGVGIAPFVSMIKHAVQEKRNIQLTLIASFSSAKDAVFLDELKDLGRQYKDLKIVFTLTKPNWEDWKGEKGRISEEMMRKYIQDISVSTFRLAGSPSFVSDMEELLVEMGIELSCIKTEIFLGF